MSLTPPQIQQIKSSVPAVKQHGADITKLFYADLLHDLPDLNNVFNTANQASSHQALALASALAAYAANIDDLGKLTPAVEQICAKHASLYISADSYGLVGTYLLQAMGKVLGGAFTPELKEAWGSAYWDLAHLMIAREAQILKESDGWTDWRDCVIASKTAESEDEGVVSFVLKPKDGKGVPRFRAGQYVSVLLDVPRLGWLQSRQYSVSCAPGWAEREGAVRVSVKREAWMDAKDMSTRHPGYVSTVLHDETKERDAVKVSHPQGVFVFDESKSGPVVLISAGVGITPMVSILDTLVEEQKERKVTWVHATRSGKSMAFAEHVRQVAEERRNMSRIVFCKEPGEGEVKGKDYTHTGRLALGEVEKDQLYLGDDKADYYICGPEGFMFDVAGWLKDNGVAEERIKMELFGVNGVPKA